MLKRTLLLGMTAISMAFIGSSYSEAAALRDKFCKDVHLRFFVGGAEGDAFGSIVYNGAKQAQNEHWRTS